MAYIEFKEVRKEYGSGEALLFSQGYADIIFLDIRMKGENGVETARRLRKQHNNSILIFVTALKEYVFEAFDVSAFHYLLKPLEATRFQQVLLRAVQEAINRKANTSPPLFLKMKGRNITLNQQSIIYLENHLKKVEIHVDWLDDYRCIGVQAIHHKNYLDLQIEPVSFSVDYDPDEPDEHDSYPLESKEQLFTVLKQILEE